MKKVLLSAFMCSALIAHTIKSNAQRNPNLSVAQFNTKYGSGALQSVVNGQANSAFGAFALSSDKDGSYNTATGAYSLFSNQIGNNNTAIGYEALFWNTAGHNNTSIGMFSSLNTTGNDNSVFGYQALFLNKTGTSNCAFGVASMYNDSTGFGNTAFGYKTMQTNKTGSFNTAIGLLADVSSSNFTNATALGHSTKATASNQVRIGNSAVTSIGGFVDWTDLPSDGRFKLNVKENIPGLKFIKLLRPVTYTVDINAVNKQLGVQADNNENFTSGTKEIHSGFIAQEVEAAAKQLNYDFNGVDPPKNADDMYGIRYAKFVVPLVKAVQELSQENQELKDRLDKIEALLSANTNVLNPKIASQATAFGLKAKLEQNYPNPYTNTTTISYFLPANVKDAAINFYASDGSLIKAVKINGEGKGMITVNGNELSSGVYRYSLIIDGNVSDTKQMLRAK